MQLTDGGTGKSISIQLNHSAQLICNLNTSCLVDTNQSGGRRSQIDLFTLTELQFNWPSNMGNSARLSSPLTLALPHFPVASCGFWPPYRGKRGARLLKKKALRFTGGGTLFWHFRLAKQQVQTGNPIQ